MLLHLLYYVVVKQIATVFILDMVKEFVISYHDQ